MPAEKIQGQTYVSVFTGGHNVGRLCKDDFVGAASKAVRAD